jgi:hypothetical protein
MGENTMSQFACFLQLCKVKQETRKLYRVGEKLVHKENDK